MSIQTEIDNNVTTEEGRYRHSFVISGESGDANVPENVHVRFYDCTISTLTLNGKSTVMLDGGTCQTISGKASSILARGVTFSGDATLDDCDANLFNCTVSGGQWILKKKSFLRADNSTFSGGDVAVDAKEGGSARITRCTFSGHGTAAARADSGAWIVLSKCSSVKGSTTAVWAKEKAVIEVIDCALVQGTGARAARAEKSGRVEFLNCPTVKGATDAAFAETKGMIVMSKCQQIIGEGGAAIKLDTEARAEVRSFLTLKGQSDSAIKLLNKNHILIADGQTLQSDAKDAVEATTESTAELVSIQTVKGQGRDGLGATSKSTISAFRIQTITGNGRHGASADDSSRLSFGDVENLKGVAGHGIKASNKSKVDATGIQNLTGQSGHGADLSDSSWAMFKGCQTITGQSGAGINMANKAVLILSKCPTVTGQSGDGVAADDSCLVRIAGGNDITGQSGAGIKITGGGALHVTGTKNITGQSGHGIEAADAVVRLRAIDLISSSSGNGIDLSNPDFEMVACPTVSGTETGLAAAGRGPELDRVVIDGANITGQSAGLDLSSVQAKTRGIVVNGETALKLASVHQESSKDVFAGDADLQDSALLYWQSEIRGKLTWKDSFIYDLRSKLGSDLDQDAVGGFLAGTKMPSGQSSGSGLYAAKASLGSIELDGDAVSLMAGAGGADLSGKGSVVSALAGKPQDGVDFLSMEENLIRLQNKDVSYFEADADTLTSHSPTGSEMVIETDITVTSEGDITETAQGAYSCTAQTTWEGTGNSTATLTGQSSLTVTSSGVTNVEGSIVNVQ